MKQATNGQVTLVCLTAIVVASILTHQTEWIGTAIVLLILYWIFVR